MKIEQDLEAGSPGGYARHDYAIVRGFFDRRAIDAVGAAGRSAFDKVVHAATRHRSLGASMKLLLRAGDVLRLHRPPARRQVMASPTETMASRDILVT